MTMHDRRQQARAVVKEGAAEVTDKLREDLSKWSRARRLVSLKPEIACGECDSAGKIQCSACGGSGHQRAIAHDEAPPTCPRCGGAGATTCVACAGRGRVPNANRKRLIWVLCLGGVAWALVLLQLIQRDFLPEQKAAVFQRGEHGQAVTALPPRSGAGPSGGASIPMQPGRGGVSVGGPVAPPQGGVSMPAGGGYGRR